MRIRSWSWLVLVLSSLALSALAQTQPANTVRTLLAAGHLGSVVDTPLYFRLFAVRLPAMERVSYSGPNSMLYVLSGTLTVALDGTAQTVAGPEGRTLRIQPHPGHPAGGHASQPFALSIGRGFVLRHRWHGGCHGGWEDRTESSG